MSLNFHQLHIFYMVAAKGSFSAAAQALHMTQPAVTMQIQSLEEYFGTKLFHRSTKKLQVSDAGRTLLPYAKRSLDLVQETEHAMTHYTNELHGRLQLGASLTIGEYVLPPMLGAFSSKHPRMTLQLQVTNTRQIVEGIRTHQLDLGLVEAPVTDSDVEVEPVMEDELLLIVPSGHPFAGQGIISPRELMTCTFVLREQGSGTRLVMEETMRRIGMDPSLLKVVMELGSTGAVKSAVEAGLGVTMLSPSAVRHERALGLVDVLRVEGASFTRKFYAVHLRDSMLTWPAATFLSYMKQQQEKE